MSHPGQPPIHHKGFDVSPISRHGRNACMAVSINTVNSFVDIKRVFTIVENLNGNKSSIK